MFPLRFSLIKDPFRPDLRTILQGQLLNKGKDVGKSEWRCCHREDSYNKQLPWSQRAYCTLLLVIKTYANRKERSIILKNMAPSVCVSADESGINVFHRGTVLDFFFSMDCIQHCFICRPSDSTVSEDAVIEPRGQLKLVIWQSDALTTRLDLIYIG